MKITIDLRAGNNHSSLVTTEVIDKNIDAQQRAIDGKPLSNDFVLLMDTKTILEEMRKQLR